MNIDMILISKKSITKIAVVALAILLIPLIAMQLTNEVNWQLGDFIVAAVLLCFFGYVYEVLTQKSSKVKNKIVIGIIVLAALLLVWAELAVGLI
jgi:hypothetical protein